jgi:GNAT superfamily N-acetyltransferase
MKFITFLFFAIASCFAADLPANNQEIVIYRVKSHGELKQYSQFFEETGRFDSYTYKELIPNTPFGTYLLYANHDLAGIISINKRNSSDNIAEIMTNIREAYQGKGLGTKLRQHVLSEVSRNPRSIRFVESLNEWDWGHNLESLRSALNCGFGIYSIFEYAGNLSLFYPVNDTHTDEIWPQERTDALLALSNIIRNPNEYDWNNTEIKQLMRGYFKDILMSLNLSLRVDQQALFVLCCKINTPYHGDSLNWTFTFSYILQNYIQNHALSAFSGTSSTQEIAQILKIPDETKRIQAILSSKTSVTNKIKELDDCLWDD